MTDFLIALKRIAEGNMVLLVFADMKQKSVACMAHVESYTALSPTCERHTGEAFQTKEHQQCPQPSCAMAHED
jgi:hypothetical protein